MKSNADLLEQYKEEKALVIGDTDERTGLEDFPSFQEWKAEYVREYNDTHETVTIDEADARADAAVDEAEAELAAVVEALQTEIEAELAAEEENTPDEENEMSETETTNESTTPETQKPKRATRKKAPLKKPVARKATRASSKTKKAQGIFDKFYGKKTRAEIIEKFIGQAELTANGAATYYQKFKKAAS